MKQPAVYILASKPNGVLYIGATRNLSKRIWRHKNNVVPSYTQRYAVHQLVYYELHEDITQAIAREKRMKKWRRAWKIHLVEKHNPEWEDLYFQLPRLC